MDPERIYELVRGAGRGCQVVDDVQLTDEDQKLRAWLWQEYAMPEYDVDIQLRALDKFFDWIKDRKMPRGKLKVVEKENDS